MRLRLPKADKKLTGGVICYSCGEIYALGDFSVQDPLEVCGECGAELFLPYSQDCQRGYESLEQYGELLSIIPKRLHSALPLELLPQLSPFSNPQ